MQEVFEKIIEKLEKELKLADEEKLRCARENPLQFDSAKGYANGVANSIEIVKQGGVYDDVCEWKMDNVGASIGCRSDIHHTGYVNEIYCPFCKKKIKVVE